MTGEFRTIKASTESEFKDRGSKFIGYAFAVEEKDGIKLRLNELRQEHSSARHFCYGYILGEEGTDQRANDDGEPNGSAGLPILNQIKSHELTNVFVVVVRYFGGTKLGVSGLINAYKEAAKLALEKAEVVVRVPMSTITIQFAHSQIGTIERLIRQNNLEIENQKFEMECTWKIRCKRADSELIRTQFALIPDVQLF